MRWMFFLLSVQFIQNISSLTLITLFDLLKLKLFFERTYIQIISRNDLRLCCDFPLFRNVRKLSNQLRFIHHYAFLNGKYSNFSSSDLRWNEMYDPPLCPNAYALKVLYYFDACAKGTKTLCLFNG